MTVVEKKGKKNKLDKGGTERKPGIVGAFTFKRE